MIQAGVANATIMVVDDDAEVREIVSEFLSESGHRILQAGNGAEALELLQKLPDVDLIVTDVRMPGVSGIDLAEKATREHSRLKVILISGYFVSQHVSWPVLHKPFSMRELGDAVRTELAH